MKLSFEKSRNRWTLNIGQMYLKDGRKRAREYFTADEEHIARARMKDLRNDVHKAGRQWAQIDVYERVAIVARLNEIAAAGLDIHRVWASYQAAGMKQAKSVTLEIALTAFLRDLEQSGCDTDYHKWNERYLKKFIAGRATMDASKITPAEVEAWIEARSGAAETKRTEIRRLRGFFDFCVKHEFAVKNPVLLKAPSGEQAAKIIFTPDEIWKLLVTAWQKDKGILRLIVVNLYGGARVDKEAIAAIDEGAALRIPKDAAKNGHERFIEITPTLRAWLDISEPCRNANIRERMEAVRDASGVRWADNIIRKSFCSYGGAFMSEEWAAKQADHSVKIHRTTYARPVKKEDAEKVWGFGLTAKHSVLSTDKK